MTGTNSEVHPGSEVLHYPFEGGDLGVVSSKGFSNPLIEDAMTQQDISLPGINKQANKG